MFSRTDKIMDLQSFTRSLVHSFIHLFGIFAHTDTHNYRPSQANACAHFEYTQTHSYTNTLSETHARSLCNTCTLGWPRMLALS